MKIRRSAAAAAVLCLLSHSRAAAAADDATLLRVFLRDGTSLVSYGEFARVADRVVFSLPTSTASNPPLQLVNIAADRIDWDRTNQYAEAARAARYAGDRAESDYVVLSNSVGQALNEIAYTADPAKRLAIVEGARKTLAEWPQAHYNYRIGEVRQLLLLLDEAIADLRASTGSQFELSLVAVAPPPPSSEPLLPPPTPVESIEGLLMAAAVADSPVEKESLLSVALVRLTADGASLPRDWVAATRAKARRALDASVRIERSYQTTIARAIAQADQRARLGDVRGIARVLESLRRSDAALGRLRPDAVNAAIAAIEARLDAARRLSLARDRWALRAPVLRQYRTSMAAPLAVFRRLELPVEDIKELAGSSQAELTLVQRQVAGVLKLLERIVPPEECQGAHALLVSAAHLAGNAARIRRDATLAGDIVRAWDASSAAAGSLMLGAKANSEIQSLINRPQLQ